MFFLVDHQADTTFSISSLFEIIKYRQVVVFQQSSNFLSGIELTDPCILDRCRICSTLALGVIQVLLYRSYRRDIEKLLTWGSNIMPITALRA